MMYIREHFKKLCIAFICGFVLMLLLTHNLIFAYIYNSFDCHKRWSKSQYKTRYDLYAGCLVSKDGKDFTPERVIREF